MGTFHLCIAMCGMIWVPILLAWWLGIMFTSGTTENQLLEMASTALIGYILFGVGMFRELWRDGAAEEERARADDAFKAKINKEISSLKDDMREISSLKDDMREIKDMLRRGATVPAATERSVI